MKLTRERTSGRNIFDASQKTILKQPDGTTTERVVKQTFANVTVRENAKTVMTGRGLKLGSYQNEVEGNSTNPQINSRTDRKSDGR